MDITLHLMSVQEKPLLTRLMELYSYEFTRYSDDDISEFGYYGYAHIDDYWNEDGRFPYLIRVDGKIAGFALICPHCDYRKEKNARCFGEFFVMLKYRRMGVGYEVASRLFDMHPGPWEICYWPNNLPASKFWQIVVERYTNNRYETCGAKENRNMGFIFDNAAEQPTKED